jgi:hypothetical protein
MKMRELVVHDIISLQHCINCLEELASEELNYSESMTCGHGWALTKAIEVLEQYKQAENGD